MYERPCTWEDIFDIRGEEVSSISMRKNYIDIDF